MSGVGLFRIDSNGGCSRDGAREERVPYAASPPSGAYVTRNAAHSRWAKNPFTSMRCTARGLPQPWTSP
jgi:hypothetical protein